MIPEQNDDTQTGYIEEFPPFAESGDKVEPTQQKYAQGYLPGEVFPAQHENFLMGKTTRCITAMRDGVLSMEEELVNVVEAGGAEPSASDNTQVLAAVQYLIARAKAEAILAAHPVLSYYMSDDPTDPGTLFGGTWARIKDRFLWAMGDSDTVGATGGSKTVTLTSNQMPSHTHTFTGTAHSHTISGSTGSESSHTHNINGGGNASATEPSTKTVWFHGTADSHSHSFNKSKFYHRHTFKPSGTVANHTHGQGTLIFSGSETYTGTTSLETSFNIRHWENGPEVTNNQVATNLVKAYKASNESESTNIGQTDWCGFYTTESGGSETRQENDDSSDSTTMDKVALKFKHKHYYKPAGTITGDTASVQPAFTGTDGNTGYALNDSSTAFSTNTTSVTPAGWINGKTNAGTSHSHGVGTLANSSTTATGSNSSTGGGAAHDNMPPYRCAYCWQRTA